MSIRNMDADLAANKLNELFHLHRYEDCVLFLNRLSHSTLKLVIAQISLDMYLSRLPYTIEIFEALYAKAFIVEPDNFPTRALQPERLIDKMVAYFSLTTDQSRLEPIDGDKMLDSFENVIRVISYVQPNLYSRLLYFKYAIDKALLRFERDLALYNTHLLLPLSQLKNSMQGETCQIQAANNSQSFSTLNKKSLQKSNALAHALLISRASNMQTCESMRAEIVQTMANCDRALTKLNDYITDLKSQKIFKEVQFYLSRKEEEGSEGEEAKKSTVQTEASPKLKKKRNSASNDRSKSSTTLTAPNRSESVSHFARNRNFDFDFIHSSTISQDFIQNRLYLNKAMMNTVEHFLSPIKLHQLLTNVVEKIDLDKEILLVFSHLKREEKYLSSLEPLQPLFRRYSLGFERCIQIWRRKCAADSLLAANDRMPAAGRDVEQLYVVDNNESNQIDLIQASYTPAAAVASTAASATRLPQQQKARNSQYYHLIDGFTSPVERPATKYFSEVNLCTSFSANQQRSPKPSYTVNSFDLYDSELARSKKELASSHCFSESLSGRCCIESPAGSEQTLVNEGDAKKPSNDRQKLEENNVCREEVERLNQDLAEARETIARLKRAELQTKEAMETKSNEETIRESVEAKRSESIAISEASQANFYMQLTNNIIPLYENLNKRYRSEAFESLGAVKEIQNMNEFKLKLLFSVVILAFRYVKLYVRDIKRKVKTILQITERSSSSSKERSSSSGQKGQTMTPTIIVQKADEVGSSVESALKESSANVFFGRRREDESSAMLIENALNRYFQLVATTKSHDLSKIVDDVKEQLWNTLYDYPLKECQELNSYINEAVKTCWSLVNHEPQLKLDYTSAKFNAQIHERTETSNPSSDQVIQHVWPSLLDSSNNNCLSRGIVIT